MLENPAGGEDGVHKLVTFNRLAFLFFFVSYCLKLPKDDVGMNNGDFLV